MKGKKSISKYPNGGKVKPIVVNNPNDPRLKAYNDSLNLHMASLKNYNGNQLNPFEKWMLYGEKNPMKAYSSYPNSKVIKIKDNVGFVDWGTTSNKNNNKLDYHEEIVDLNGKIFPTHSYKVKGKGNDSDGFNDYYKKPVQPVIYKEGINKVKINSEQITPLYQTPQLTMPERLELSMNKPNVPVVEPNNQNPPPTFKQGRKFMIQNRVDTNLAQPGWYGNGGTTSVVRTDYDRDVAPKKGKYLLPDINRPDYTDDEGYKRSEFKMGINHEGKEYLIPTVVNGKQLTPDEAYRRFLNTGYHMGVYNSVNEAENASQKRTAKYNFLTNPVESQNTIIEQYSNGGTINNMKKRTLKRYTPGGTVESSTGATVGNIAGGVGMVAPIIEGLIPDKQYTDSEGNNLGSRKSIGESALSYGAKGAAISAMLGGADFGASAVLGAGYGAVKGWMDKNKMDEAQKKANFDISQRNLQRNMNTNVNWGNANVTTANNMVFAQGGMLLNQDDPNANAELELQETFQLPDGTVGNVDGPSHENGGIAVDLPEGTRIWSDKLKHNGKTFAKHTKPITSKIAKLEKQIAKNPVNSEAKENSIALLNDQLDYYFDTQETNKETNEMKRTFKNGGMIKRADGSYSKRGLWDNIRANKGSGKNPTAEMLEQEAKIKAEHAMGGYMYSEGGIHIKPENKGKFTAYAKAHGKGVQEMASHVLANKEDYSPTIVKRANFAHNAAGWKHANGGLVKYSGLDGRPGIINSIPDLVQNPNYQEFNPYIENEFKYEANPNYELPIMGKKPILTKPQRMGTGNYGEFYLPKKGEAYTQGVANTVGIDPNQITQANNMGNSFENTTPGTMSKIGNWFANNKGLIGQLGTAALSAGIQSDRVNSLARPRTLAGVRLSDKVVNPNLVDYSAERNAIDRAALTGMGEAQRGFGSSAATQAFKNKARLNQLEGTGRSFQAQSNANTQIKNQYLAAQQEAAMKEAMMNNEIDKYNLENVYDYDTTKLAAKNNITAILGNTASQAFGKQTDFKNQMEQAKILANARERSVNANTVIGSNYEKAYFDSLTPEQKILHNRQRTDLGLPAMKYGGTIRKRSFKK